MTKKTRAKARRALLTLSLVLVVAFAAVGGTIAWLTDTTGEVTNTFTVGNVDIKLDETEFTRTESGETITETYGDRKEQGNSYPLIPGKTYKKDPKVAVETGSETCYLFVQRINSGDNNVTFTENWNDWIKLSDEDDNGVQGDVYWRVVTKDATTREFFLLNTLEDSEHTIKVNDEAAGATAFNLEYKAFAVQKENFASAATAWDEVSANAMPTTPVDGE